MGFLEFKDRVTGEAVNADDFCKRLAQQKGLVISPGNACFEFGDIKDACAGRARFHITASTETVQEGLRLLDEFLAA